MRWSIAVMASLAALGAGGPALAQAKKPPELVGVTHVTTVAPHQGFIDRPLTFDRTGKRLAYIDADAGYRCELRVLDLTRGGARLANIDISAFTSTPAGVRFLQGGFFVVARPETAQTTAAIISGEGEIVRTFGPAGDIALTTRDGTELVAMYSREQIRRKGTPMLRHTVTLVSLAGKKHTSRELITDRKGHSSELDFRINHWTDGYTRVVGIRTGRWDPEGKQYAPDREAQYDIITGAFSKHTHISDVMERAYLMRDLAAHPNEARFLAVSHKRSGVELVAQDGRQTIALAEPFRHYDPQSLQYQRSGKGRFFFTLTIDPVHPDAVARKQTAPQYLDLYEYRVGRDRAVRRARVLLDSKRQMSWRATDEHWVLVPRLIGFARGGKELRIYELEPGELAAGPSRLDE